MKKEYIPFKKIRENAIKLAYKIYKSNFIPDVIYVCLRGGACMGNIISEYFKILRKDSTPLFYAAVVARSYFPGKENCKVIVDGWTYAPDYLRYGEKILIVDDIYDSGFTLNHLVGVILNKGIPRSDIKIAVHDYKIRSYEKSDLSIHPDFYCRIHEINSPQQDIWFHYLSHELDGISPDELISIFAEPDEILEEALDCIKEVLK